MGRCRFGHFPEQRNPWRQIRVHVPWWWSWQRYSPNCYTRLSWSRRGQHSKLLQEPAQLCCTAPWDTNHWWSKPSSHYAILRGLWTHSARLCRRCCSSCRWNFFLVWDEKHGQNEAWSRGHLQTLLVSLLFAFWLYPTERFQCRGWLFHLCWPLWSREPQRSTDLSGRVSMAHGSVYVPGGRRFPSMAWRIIE